VDGNFNYLRNEKGVPRTLLMSAEKFEEERKSATTRGFVD
jgi:hypothetical protein